jgi:hypothetical protein
MCAVFRIAQVSPGAEAHAGLRVFVAGLRHASKVGYRVAILLWSASFRLAWPHLDILAPPSRLCQVPCASAVSLRTVLECGSLSPSWAQHSRLPALLPQCEDPEEVRKSMYDPLLSLCMDWYIEVGVMRLCSCCLPA